MRLDLNLLPVFVAVYECRSVSSAAIRLGMSQPGLSTALKRLRVALEDPLFIRTPAGMQPTLRAQALIDPVRQTLSSIQTKIVPSPEFLPERATDEFRIAMSDIGDAFYGPATIQVLTRLAPHARVRMLDLPPKQLEKSMEHGDVDFALGYFPDLVRKGFLHQRLAVRTFACILRDKHPITSRRLTMQQFVQSGHAVLEATSRTQEVFEAFLRRKNIRRKITLRTSHFMSVLNIVAETDLLATVPQAVAEFTGDQLGIRRIQLPFTPPVFETRMHWHRSVDNEPKNRWLRTILMKEYQGVVQKLDGGSPSL